MALVGRERELASLAAVVDRARAGDGAALVLVGEAGIGKSALLDAASEAAAGLHVLRVSGIEAERELAFAAVHHLLGEDTDAIDRLPGPQRTAVRTALGLDDGAVTEVFNVALGVVRLVRERAADRPVLVVVDDEQWLDRTSSRAFAFLARRVAGTPVAVVFASRAPSPDLRGVPELVVGGLAPPAAGTVFDAALTGRIDPVVRQQVLHEARGNPLALLELPRGVTPSDLAGGYGLAAVSPLSHRIEATYRRRLERLPEPARRWLTLAAADPVGAPDTLWAAASCSGLGPRAARCAEASGLVALDTRVTFCHPLARSAVYRAAGVEQRREAHRALAEVTDPHVDPDRRAWHLAQAATAPADDVADELERAARRAHDRGGQTAAAAFLERPATLTAARVAGAQRMLA
ncbi:AAA family ATPase, partial [Jatrophihabitans sp. YIM 134969]